MKRLAIHSLQSGMVLAQDVFSLEDSQAPLIPEGAVLTDRMIDALIRNGIIQVYIVGEGEDEEVLAMPENSIYIPEPSINDQTRTKALDNLEDIFMMAKNDDAQVSAPKLIRQLDEVVDELINTLKADQRTLVNIADLKSYDDYTYHHSLSVSVLSIAIAQALQFKNRELRLLGRCAMMHDIGKILIPIEIINKPGKLTDEEFHLVRSHAEEGYKYLVNNNIGDIELWRGVLHHHEKYDGSGYPKGLAGEEIPLLSRIISVADVYDALTSNRPYREPMQPAEGIEYIMGSVGTAFDYDIVKAFLEKIELYPVNSLVELSSGQIAVVVDNYNAMRPKVKEVKTGRMLDLFSDMDCLSLTITKMLPIKSA